MYTYEALQESVEDMFSAAFAVHLKSVTCRRFICSILSVLSMVS